MNIFAIVVFTVTFVSSCFTVSAAPALKSKPPQQSHLVKNDHIYDNKGQFSFNYELDDGTSQTRQGMLVLNSEGDDYVMIQKGTYAYVSPEGIKVNVVFLADKDGFRTVQSITPSDDVPAIKIKT